MDIQIHYKKYRMLFDALMPKIISQLKKDVYTSPEVSNFMRDLLFSTYNMSVGLISEGAKLLLKTGGRGSTKDHIFGRTAFLQLILNELLNDNLSKFDSTFAKYLMCAGQVAKLDTVEHKELKNSKKFGIEAYNDIGLKMYDESTGNRVKPSELKNYLYFDIDDNKNLIETGRERNKYINEMLLLF